MNDGKPWENVCLRWVSSISAGGTPSKDVDEYWEGNIPWINSGEINQRKICNPSAYITDKGLSESSTRIYPKNTVMVALAGQGKTKGKAGILTFECACNQSLAGIECDLSQVDPRFLLYRLEADYFRLRGIAGEARDGLNLENLKSWRISLPPVDEQQRIVKWLDSKVNKIDLLLSKGHKSLELLEEQRTNYITAKLTKHDLVSGNPVSIDWVREIPEDWRETKLKYVSSSIIDSEHKTPPNHGGEYYIVRTSDVRDGEINLQNSYTTGEEVYQEWTKRGKPEKNDLIFTREAPAGEVGIVPENNSILLGQRTVLIKSDQSKITPRYLYYCLQSEMASWYINILSRGSTVDHLNISDLKNIPILLPPLESQERIVSEISDNGMLNKSLQERVSSFISLLEEKRHTIIRRAVDGKIDLTDWRPAGEEKAVQ